MNIQEELEELEKEEEEILPAVKEEEPIDSMVEIRKADSALIDNIVKTDDIDELKDLTHLFNAFQTKRHILRVNALNDVQDALVAQMAERLKSQPHNFNNNDIANWMKTVQQAMDSSQRSIEAIDETPAIVHQNNTQVNINIEDTLSRESREKILDVINNILQSSNNDESDGVYTNDEIVEEFQINGENNLGENTNGNKEDSSN